MLIGLMLTGLPLYLLYSRAYIYCIIHNLSLSLSVLLYCQCQFGRSGHGGDGIGTGWCSGLPQSSRHAQVRHLWGLFVLSYWGGSWDWDTITAVLNTGGVYVNAVRCLHSSLLIRDTKAKVTVHNRIVVQAGIPKTKVSWMWQRKEIAQNVCESLV